MIIEKDFSKLNVKDKFANLGNMVDNKMASHG